MTSVQLLILLSGASLAALLGVAAESEQAMPLTDPSYGSLPSKELYRFNVGQFEGGHHEEIGLLLYPGTPQQELVVKGKYEWKDYKTLLQTTIIYTADKHGYRAQTTITHLFVGYLSPNLLKSTTG